MFIIGHHDHHVKPWALCLGLFCALCGLTSGPRSGIILRLAHALERVRFPDALQSCHLWPGSQCGPLGPHLGSVRTTSSFGPVQEEGPILDSPIFGKLNFELSPERAKSCFQISTPNCNRFKRFKRLVSLLKWGGFCNY